MTTPAGKRSDIFKKQVTPYVYLLPTIILMLILLIIPIIMVIRYSFFDNVIINKNPTFVGLENFAKVLTDPTFLVAIKNTLYFVIISIIAHLVIGMFFAMLLKYSVLHPPRSFVSCQSVPPFDQPPAADGLFSPQPQSLPDLQSHNFPLSSPDTTHKPIPRSPYPYDPHALKGIGENG